MLAKVRTPAEATCKAFLQLKASFIDVKKLFLQWGSNQCVWNTIPMLDDKRCAQVHTHMDAFNRFIYEIIIQNTMNNAQTGSCYFYDLCYVYLNNVFL